MAYLIDRKIKNINRDQIKFRSFQIKTEHLAAYELIINV